MKLLVDHIVVSVRNLKRSTTFYSSFLGKAKITKWDVSWQVGNTKLFLTHPYTKKAKTFNKHNLGLNHIAFGLNNIKELKTIQSKLTSHRIKHSGIVQDQYSGKSMIWFDDLDGIRLEFFVR